MAQGLTNAPAGDVTKKDLAQKAEKTHKHSAADITSGTLPVARGGTGNTTGNAATATKLATARTIRTNLGSTNTASFDGTANITPGVDGTLPVANGGTGATDVSTALSNLGGFPKRGGTINGDVTINGKVAEGHNTQATGYGSHAEGWLSIASADGAHAEGWSTEASEHCSHAEGYETKASGTCSHAEGHETKASGNYSHAEGSGTKAEDSYSHAEGMGTIASGYCSHAEGNGTTASQTSSHAEGTGTTASGYYAHAEGGGTTAEGWRSHAEGWETIASESSSHAEGWGTSATGNYSHAEGRNTTASEYGSHASGEGTKASAGCQTAIGKYNKESTSASDLFIIGNGSKETNNYGELISEHRSNCLRVTKTDGVFSNAVYNSTGADYAELFQWLDDNNKKEDRVGLFVTLDGEKIRVAEPEDTYILGVVSACPSVLGDVYDDQWKGMYETDIYGRPIFEEVEVPAETMEVPDPENPEQTITKVICKAHKEIRQKLNPNYDPTQEYIPRSERPEWDAVGMMGKLVVIDDGTCKVNGWCTVGNGGIATNSEKRTKYRVMARLDKTHVKIMIL